MKNEDTNEAPEQAIQERAPAKPSPAAQRMRTYRKQRSPGMRCVMLHVQDSEIDRLVELGYLRQTERENQNTILAAPHQFLDQSALAAKPRL